MNGTANADEYYIKRNGNIHKTAPHHASFKALWETKWQKPVRDSFHPVGFSRH